MHLKIEDVNGDLFINKGECEIQIYAGNDLFHLKISGECVATCKSIKPIEDILKDLSACIKAAKIHLNDNTEKTPEKIVCDHTYPDGTNAFFRGICSLCNVWLKV